ncbi:hypothetical protein [Vibrio genomosp. F10]|uniref:Uncharacterized protein n=1 Tax=Vibrio genomosp. F10 TaxID=723171 RepID=A0A1B9R2M9_9VIBR|nr:hypothetical protein [Vibrio genomosp. F10]OCH78509.1 hypothetical protein A6E14_17545 [Vibrio genomosp. F10]
MAVVPKQNESQRYDPSKELTTEQRQRFTDIANKAQQRREYERKHSSVISAARSAATKTVIKPRKDSPNTARYVIWLIVAALVSLWAMYMAG